MFSGSQMFGGFASQGFAMGATQDAGTQNVSTQDAAAKKPRQEEKQACLPVTIRTIQAALERRTETGGELTFFGVEPGMLVVVASVEQVSRQAASLEMTLNDGTGRIKARWFLSDPQNGELDRITAGCYVSAFGNARAAPVEHLAITGMRTVESADEVSYHTVEAVHAALRLQKGKPQPTTPTKKTEEQPVKGPASQDAITPQKEMLANPYTVASTVTAEQQFAALPSVAEAQGSTVKPAMPAPAGPPSGADLRAAVLDLLRQGTVGPEGLALDVMAEKVGAPRTEVKSTLGELVDDGEIFTTITEEHFAVV